MNCPHCDAPLRQGANFCTACGQAVGPRRSSSGANRAFVLAGAGVGVLLILGVVWLLTSQGSGDALAATTTTSEAVVESTLRTIPPPDTTTSDPTTTTSVATTTTVSEEQAAYVSALAAVLSEAESAAGDIEAASTNWDTEKDSLDAGDRSRLWRTTQGAFQVAIIELEEVQAALDAIDVPDGNDSHGEIVTTVGLLVQHAEAALEGLQLPRGSEEVDGTMRLEAIAEMNATLDQLRDAIGA